MANVQDIFAFRNVSESVEAVKAGIPDVLPKAFKTLTEKVLGNETTYHSFYGQRKLVRRTEYAGPPLPYAQQKVGQQGVILASFAGEVKIEQELLMRLRQADDLMAQDRAREFIARASTDHIQRFANNRLAHMHQMVWKGAFWYDATGKLLQSSSGAVATLDMGVPAGNKNQVGGIIAASWATDTTDIFGHVEALKKKAVQATGRPLKHAYYGINIPTYIYKNASFKYYFQHNPLFYSAFANNPGSIPNGFLGLDWHPMRDAFYEQEDATVTQLFDDDQVTFTPDMDKSLYTLFEGSVVVPTKFGIGAGVEEIIADTKVAYGQTGWCKFDVQSSLVGKLVYVDNFMPVWKTPLDVYLVDVTP